MAKTRRWDIEAEDPQPEGWVPDGAPLEIQADDEDALTRALFEASWILNRLGGVIGVAAVREEIAPGIWKTASFVFSWESYAPARRREEPKKEPPQEPDAELSEDEIAQHFPEPDPVEA